MNPRPISRGAILRSRFEEAWERAARIRNIVKHSLAFNANQTVDIGDRPTFYVVIIYEDSGAGRRAKHFYDRVIQELEDECDFSLELWSFQVLALPGIGNAAARAAAQADFVILSRSGLISDCKPALVAVIGRPNLCCERRSQSRRLPPNCSRRCERNARLQRPERV
jgi:hypothetical protein